MNATPITLSPRWSIDRAERRVRTELARGNAAVIAVKASDARQKLQLRRLFGRLAADQSLSVVDGLMDDGTGTLIVTPAGTPSTAWWHGEFKTA